MSAPGQMMGDVFVAPELTPRRITTRARAADTEAAAALAAARADVGRVSQRLAAVAQVASDVAQELTVQRRVRASVAEQLAAEREQVALLGSVLAAERARAEARVRQATEQAAAAIRLAEERAAAAMRAAHETLCAVAAQPAAGAPRDVGPHGAAGSQPDAGASALERRLATELEHLRRERDDHEDRLRAELDRVTTEKLELATRLSICEHVLGEQELELQRERQLADEAMRWASSIERELDLPVASGSAADCSAPAVDPAIPVLRRRAGRVRLRPAS